MRADGFDIRNFAYPGGRRNKAIDAFLAPYFDRIRAFTPPNWLFGAINVKWFFRTFGSLLDTTIYTLSTYSDVSTLKVPYSVSIDHHVIDLDTVFAAMDKASREGSYLLVSSHVIDRECHAEWVWCITNDNLDKVLAYAKSKNMTFLRFQDLPEVD